MPGDVLCDAEQGFYRVRYEDGSDDRYFEEIFQRFEPLTTSHLIINNDFDPDLPETLLNGNDKITEQVSSAAKKIDEMDLWPAPFPIQDLLPSEDFRHVKRLYGIGGLSYGNLSPTDQTRFWRSASGVNKANLQEIWRDILMVKR